MLDPGRISPTVDEALNSPENQLWLSPISIWEALLLSGKGRVRLGADPVKWIRDAMQLIGEAPLTYEIAIAADKLPQPHRDPADRFITATSQALDLTLVTADRWMLGLRNVKTIGND
jgi:PIN domain nuclease of toxin-antitoxin system